MVNAFLQSNFGKAAFIIVFTFLFLTRVFDLSSKPFHHDESQYANGGWKYAQHFDYQFNPMLHGPFLYTFHAALFKIFPDNDFTGRLPTALAGILLCIIGFLLFMQNGYLGTGFLFLTLCTFSPTISYFSRFLTMDITLAFLSILFIFLFMKFSEKESTFYLLFLSLITGFMICTKLNALFYLFVFFTFPLIAYAFSVDRNDFLKKMIHPYINWFWKNKLSILASLLVLVLCFCLLYSTFGKNIGGILDGLYRKMIPYWLHQNKIQRIYGPFHYYWILMAVYELPFAILLLVSWGFRIKKDRFLAISGFVIGFSYLVAILIWPTTSSFMRQRFHLDFPFHVPMLLALLLIGFKILYQFIQEKKYGVAFAQYWVVFSILIYSYAGEKVPWLLVHLMLPIFFYLSFEIQDFLEFFLQKKYVFKNAVLGFACLILAWQGFVLVRSSILISADPREMLVYTHTSHDIQKLVDGIEKADQRLHSGGKALPISIMGRSDGVWPMAWYLRHFRTWFQYDNKPLTNAAIVLDNWDRKEETSKLLMDSYIVRKIKLREWWVPNNSLLSFSKALSYYFFRQNFSPLGSFDLVLFIRSDLINDFPYFEESTL